MKKLFIYLLLPILAFALAGLTLNNSQERVIPPIESLDDLMTYPFNTQKFSLPMDATPGSDAHNLAVFAWQEMIALNWKATYAKGNYERDAADTNWSYADAVPNGYIEGYQTFQNGDVLST